ncbi:MAG: hypothetical protein V3T84_06240 [Phycisphaerales bacterium]
MFAKLLLIILITGATACILLVNRQQRIETANEIAHIHRCLLEHDQALWTMRNEVAARCQPDEVRLAIATLAGAWRPIPSPPRRDARSATQLAGGDPEPNNKLDLSG